MNLQGIISFYDMDTGDYLHPKYLSLECSIKDAIEQLTELA